MRDTYTNFTYNNQTYVFNKCAQHTKDTREINIKIYLMNLHPDKDVLPLNIWPSWWRIWELCQLKMNFGPLLWLFPLQEFQKLEARGIFTSVLRKYQYQEPTVRLFSYPNNNLPEISLEIKPTSRGPTLGDKKKAGSLEGWFHSKANQWSQIRSWPGNIYFTVSLIVYKNVTFLVCSFSCIFLFITLALT